jgi:hypothetical protein
MGLPSTHLADHGVGRKDHPGSLVLAKIHSMSIHMGKKLYSFCWQSSLEKSRVYLGILNSSKLAAALCLDMLEGVAVGVSSLSLYLTFHPKNADINSTVF